jgi:hypothetical protein
MVKTDNSFFEEKMKLRVKNLPEGNPLRVLDLYSGNGLIWSEIEKRTGREIRVLRIDRERGRRGTYLIGNNLKFNLDPGAFDVVDVDAWGVPFRQLEKIFSSPSAEGPFYHVHSITMGRPTAKNAECLGLY